MACRSANIAVCYPHYRTVEEVCKKYNSFERFNFHTGPKEETSLVEMNHVFGGRGKEETSLVEMNHVFGGRGAIGDRDHASE
jgi:hypothetical protein